MKIFDTLQAKKVELEPIEEGKIGMYVCGPTVYDSAHLGHGRSAVAFDVMRRYLIYKGYKVKYVSNYTDIEDKMINRANQEGITVEQLAKKIIPEYERDYGALKVMTPDVQPLATDHIEEMIELIKRLEVHGYVYVLDDGVYYDVKKFEEYGKLSKQKLEDLQVGSRVEVKQDKHSPYDFVLWKFKKEGEPFWSSPWGDGRPGWHIECSAMTWKHLGEKFDIHGGGLDLTFPHHECEIAQSEPVFGHGSFSKYWLHNGFIQVNNEKMSKSLGNFFTLKDIFVKYDPVIVRFMFLQTHYRNPVNFSDALLDQAKAGLERIHGFVRTLKNDYDLLPKNIFEQTMTSARVTVRTLSELENLFAEFMDNDFDTSGALGVVFDLISTINGLRTVGKLTREEVDSAYEFLTKIDKVLGVIFVDTNSIDGDIEKLIKEREEARKSKNFKRSDEIRDELLKKGIVLEDTKDGTIWKKA